MDDIVCRYFVGPYGCRLGWRCPFPHVLSFNRRPDTICRYFLDGRCAFGDRCWHQHTYLPSYGVYSSFPGNIMSFQYGQGTLTNFSIPYGSSSLNIFDRPFEPMQGGIPPTFGSNPENIRYAANRDNEDFRREEDMSPDCYNQPADNEASNYLSDQMVQNCSLENQDESSEAANSTLPVFVYYGDMSNLQGASFDPCMSNPSPDEDNDVDGAFPGNHSKLIPQDKIYEQFVARCIQIPTTSNSAEGSNLTRDEFSSSSVTRLEETTKDENEGSEPSKYSLDAFGNTVTDSENPEQVSREIFASSDIPAEQPTNEKDSNYELTFFPENRDKDEEDVKTYSDWTIEFNSEEASSSGNFVASSEESLNINRDSKNVPTKCGEACIESDRDASNDSSVAPDTSYWDLSPSVPKNDQEHSIDSHYSDNDQANESNHEKFEKSPSSQEKEITSDDKRKKSRRSKKKPKQKTVDEKNRTAEPNADAPRNTPVDKETQISNIPSLTSNKTTETGRSGNRCSRFEQDRELKNRGKPTGVKGAPSEEEKLERPEKSTRNVNRQRPYRGRRSQHLSDFFKGEESAARRENVTQITDRQSQLCRSSVPSTRNELKTKGLQIKNNAESQASCEGRDGAKSSGSRYNRSESKSCQPPRHQTNTEHKSFRGRNRTFSSRNPQSTRSPPHSERGTPEVPTNDPRTENQSPVVTGKDGETSPLYSTVLSRNISKCSMCHQNISCREAERDRVYGILENCTHMYCLKCILWWRCVRNNSPAGPTPGVRCPECNAHSACIIPSRTWTETPAEKRRLVARYKRSLKRMHCKFFKRGAGVCVYGDDCLYLHSVANQEAHNNEDVPRD